MVPIFASTFKTPFDPGSFSLSLVFSVIFEVVPGGLVIFRSQWLADRSIPETMSTTPPSAAELVVAAVSVLGIYLIVEGLAPLLGYTVAIAGLSHSLSTGFFADYASRIVGSALIVCAGLFLFIYATRIGRILRKRSSPIDARGGGAT